MEDYDVLGNFKDLKTIFKNIPAAPLQPAPLLMENSFSELDVLLDGSSSSTDNKPKHNSKKKQSTKIAKKEDTLKTLDQEQKNKEEADLAESKTKSDVVTTVGPPANNTNSTEPAIGTRTRRSLRSQNTSILHETAANNDSLKNTKKSGRGRTRTAISTTITEVTSAVAEKPTRGRKRAGNSTDNSTTIAQVAPVAMAEITTRGRRKRAAAQPAAPVAVTQPATIDTIEISDTFETRDATRARRNLIADVAARCPTVGVVDLVSSPVVRVEGFIDLVDDDKPNTSKATPQQQQQSMDFSFNEDNPEMNVKVNWEFKLKTFELRKYQKFEKIFEELAKEQNIDVNSVVLNLNSHFIKPDDTPASIDYKIYQFIEGRAMKPTEFGGTRAIKKKRDANVVKLKIQTNKHKKPMLFELKKTESFRTLVIKCAEELKVSYENITKLCFDGETVDINQTPVDLELDGGEMIEIHLKD